MGSKRRKTGSVFSGVRLLREMRWFKTLMKTVMQRWTVVNVHAVHDQRSETLAKSCSRQVHIQTSKTNDQMYIDEKTYFYCNKYHHIKFMQ